MERPDWFQGLHGNDLAGDGGPPHDNGMEQRVAKLEDDVREMRGDIKALIKDVAEIKGRLQAMPTTWQLVATNIGLAIAIVGGMAAVFALVGK